MNIIADDVKQADRFILVTIISVAFTIFAAILWAENRIDRVEIDPAPRQLIPPVTAPVAGVVHGPSMPVSVVYPSQKNYVCDASNSGDCDDSGKVYSVPVRPRRVNSFKDKLRKSVGTSDIYGPEECFIPTGAGLIYQKSCVGIDTSRYPFNKWAPDGTKMVKIGDNHGNNWTGEQIVAHGFDGKIPVDCVPRADGLECACKASEQCSNAPR